MPDAKTDETWPPAWTIAAPRPPERPLIALDWLVKDRLRELRAQLTFATYIDRHWGRDA